MLPDEESIYPRQFCARILWNYNYSWAALQEKKLDMIRQIARTVILKK